MKINVDQELKTLAGETLKDEQGKAVTLKFAIIQAMCGHYPKEDIDGVEKMKRYKIAFNTEKGGEQEFSVEEVSKMKDLISKWGPVLIVGQVLPMLDETVK